MIGMQRRPATGSESSDADWSLSISNSEIASGFGVGRLRRLEKDR